MPRLLSSPSEPWDKYERIKNDALAYGNSTSDILKTYYEGDLLRIGHMLVLVAATLSSRTTTELAAFMAVRDFNARSNVYETVFDEDCNFYLTIDFAEPFSSLLTLAQAWQSEALFYTRSELRPFSVLGGITSSESAFIATLGAVAARTDSTDLASLQGIPNISPSSTSSDLDDRNRYPLFSRTIPSSIGDSVALCTFLQSLGVRELAVLYINDLYGINFFADISSAAADNQLHVSGFNYDPGLPGSVDSAIQRMLSDDDFAYYFGVFASTTWQEVCSKLYDAELIGNPDKAWFFSDTMLDANEQTFDVGSELGDAIAAAINRTALLTLSPPEDLVATHLEELERARNDSQYLDLWEEQHLGPAPQDYELKPTVSTMLAYDAVLAVGLAACQSKDHSADIDGPQLSEWIRVLRFKGATGNVFFNQTTGTRDPRGLSYRLSNFLVDTSDGKYTVNAVPSIEVQNSNGSLVVRQQMLYPSGTMTPPSPLPPAYNSRVPLGINILIWILGSGVILFTLFCAGWTIKNRDHPQVMSAQPPFLVLLCFGTLLVGISVLLGTLQEPISKDALSSSCIAKMWLASIGFTTVFAGLFSKTWRINRVYAGAKQFRRVEVRAKHVVWPLIILLSVNIIILATWTAIHPVAWNRVVIREDALGRPIATWGTCISLDQEDNYDTIFLSLLSAINVLALLLCSYESYKARNLPSKFNESYYIAVTNVILIEDFVIGIPLLFVVDNDTTAFALIIGLIGIIFCLAILLPMFIPKFKKGKDDKEKRFVTTMQSAVARSAVGSKVKSRWRTIGETISSIKRNVVSSKPSPLERSCPPTTESQVASSDVVGVDTRVAVSPEAAESKTSTVSFAIDETPISNKSILLESVADRAGSVSDVANVRSLALDEATISNSSIPPESFTEKAGSLRGVANARSLALDKATIGNSSIPPNGRSLAVDEATLSNSSIPPESVTGKAGNVSNVANG